MLSLRTLLPLIALTAALVALPACGDDGDDQGGAAVVEGPAATLPATLFVAAAPTEFVHVFDLKQSAKEGDQVTVRGRIGGSKEPFVVGRAVAKMQAS